jgi:NAD(P)-dependent dehydrogenase (short-subunit alcohol dehydrogenase family)
VADRLERAGAHVVRATAATSGEAAGIAAAAIEQHGRVDVLVNAPPPVPERATADSAGAEAAAHHAAEVSYYAPLRLILALVPAMRLQGGGHVVNVCLAAGGAREQGCAAQIAAAAALDAFGRCFAPEVDELRIPVTTVHVALTPGAGAAHQVLEAIVHRPKRVGTPWGTRDPIAALAPVLRP